MDLSGRWLSFRVASSAIAPRLSPATTWGRSDPLTGHLGCRETAKGVDAGQSGQGNASFKIAWPGSGHRSGSFRIRWHHLLTSAKGAHSQPKQVRMRPPSLAGLPLKRWGACFKAASHTSCRYTYLAADQFFVGACRSLEPRFAGAPLTHPSAGNDARCVGINGNSLISLSHSGGRSTLVFCFVDVLVLTLVASPPKRPNQPNKWSNECS